MRTQKSDVKDAERAILQSQNLTNVRYNVYDEGSGWMRILGVDRLGGDTGDILTSALKANEK